MEKFRGSEEREARRGETSGMLIEGTEAESEGDDTGGDRGTKVGGAAIATPLGMDMRESISSTSGLLSVRRALSSAARKSSGSNDAQAYSNYKRA